MFIAMNRFRVAKGSETDFEHVWLSRDSHLDRCLVSPAQGPRS
jgi:heme-degrading monooxygenase HmoA